MSNYPRVTRRRTWAQYCLCILILSVFLGARVEAQALTQPPPQEALRQLYFKLPLAQPRFHWRFTNVDAFLRGRLMVRIIRDGISQSIVVFDQGVISAGWRPIGSAGREGMYFGFRSSERYMTSARDSLEIELIAAEDLPGIGARMSGVLPAGTYRATGSYSVLTGYPSEKWLPLISMLERIPLERLKAMPEAQALVQRLNGLADDLDSQAMMQCWREAWPLEPSGSGWLGARETADAEASERASEAQLSTLRTMLEESGSTAALPLGLGTDGLPCS